ncbi:MAG: hypothetical protein ISS83_02470 [Candidatus Pacebacteria bacterium]|nr:hypothetical protein [Candidatus Paceibacterota bacterium]
MVLNEFKNKRILILGFGKEGKDAFLFFRKMFPSKVMGIADKNQIKVKAKRIKKHFGKNYLKSLKKYDIVIKSPGIPFKILPKSEIKKIVTQTDIFFNNCKGKIVGITGTKGKSTTASLIFQILKKAGLKVHLVGNIGKPILNLLSSTTNKDIYVYELSSHQLYNLKKSPQVAVFLNIYPEHLDYYRSFKEYALAKANIARYQKKEDFLIFNSQDKIIKAIAKKSKAKKIPIKGKYYELNKAAAKAAAKVFKIKEKIIEKAIKEFKPLPHRLELVGTYKGITFYNDALATIPEATIAAMDTLGKRVETIMLGGFDRKIDFKKLAEKVLKNGVRTVILFPTTGQKIWKEIVRQAKKERPNHFFANNMERAVKVAYQYTGENNICLLSTASSSFSIFKDYEEKGNLFKKYVRKYGTGKKI